MRLFLAANASNLMVALCAVQPNPSPSPSSNRNVQSKCQPCWARQTEIPSASPLKQTVLSEKPWLDLLLPSIIQSGVVQSPSHWARLQPRFCPFCPHRALGSWRPGKQPSRGCRSWIFRIYLSRTGWLILFLAVAFRFYLGGGWDLPLLQKWLTNPVISPDVFQVMSDGE